HYGGNSPSSDDDDDDDDARDYVAEIIAHVLAQLAIYGIEKAAPHVGAWWKDKAAPALKEKAVPAIKAAPGKVKAAPRKVKASLKRKSNTKASEGTRGPVRANVVHDDGAAAMAGGQDGSVK